MTKVLATLIIATALSMAATAQAGVVSLTNPGFENSPYDSGWTGWGDTRWEGKWSTGGIHSGTNSLGAADTGGYSVGVHQDFIAPVTGQNYTYTGYVKTVNLTSGNAWTILEWYDASNALIGSAIDSNKLNGTNAWTPLVINSVAPGNAVKGKAVFKVAGGASGQDSFFDDASVTYDPVPEPASLLLLGSGLVGLFGLKKRTAK